jgi:exopolyphosphatase/guanosine-5'-triphosphate,3'-diphosphate pyrophosphatase
VCFDLGGGSLEITVGDAGGLRWGTSVHLGVARLTAELIQSDPPAPDDRRRLRQRLTSVLVPVADDVADFAPTMAIGSSGTLCDLARMVAAERDGAVPVSVNQLSFTADEFLPIHERLLRLPAAERARLSGLDPRRADQAPAGSMFLATAFELFGIERFAVSEWALREGIVLDAIGHHDPADWSADPRAIRLASVLSLARRCGWDEAHSRKVASLAGDLFDRTLPLHRLGPDDRELLEHAALLHDIGEHVAVDGHHKHTAYLIQHGKLRGFSPDDIAVLATLGRFHRRSDPKSSFEPYGSLPPERKEATMRLLALLRLADGLDRGHGGTVDGLDADIGKTRVRLLVESTGDMDLELWGLRRKRELFERLFERSLDVVAADHPSLGRAG